MTKPRHSHVLGLITHLAKQIQEYWFLFILLLWQWGNLSPLWRGVAIAALVVWFLAWPITKWATLTYIVTPDAVVIHSGIFVRHQLHIPYPRIQTVQRQQWFYLRPFHLETLKLETASHEDGQPEVRLPAVPTSVADTINTYRQATTKPSIAATVTTESAAPTAIPQSQGPSYRITHRALTQFALTSTGVIPLVLVLLGIYGKLPKDWENQALAQAAHYALPFLVGAIIVVLLIAWVGAYLWVLIRYYHFTLTKTGDQLETVKGLFQRNTVTAPIDRIQAVRFKQNILRQWLHLQTVQVLLASKAATDDDDHDLVLLPAIAQDQLYATLHPFIPWVPATAPQLTDFVVPRQARWLLNRNALLVVALPVILLCWLWQPWGYLSLFLLPLAYFQGRFVARNTGGRRLSDELVMLQTGHVWTRETFVVRRQQIQSLEVNFSVWMRPKHLAHLTVNVRHGNRKQAIELRYLSAKQVHALYDWYTN
ncbi:PH domain-containing protein [Levilactobacillus acidifarinae]|uniref:YdbS-like PH domain-containing protein n=1 Tax=Levilactobacillus acidifarinae DSM 19394 = JCM 15949 TaxID=1423715 RepID=A0A0R1LWQ4_9LACO|nr:PH domain-containing protein [Levilactobacillus acidifarinae]KRK96706.1 hypothetical protein FD25_GL001785 [Levilactobacillus acidifarinae DSM 19394]GEO70403.1 membrane protein [Levilactobacillus acidifarinae]